MTGLRITDQDLAQQGQPLSLDAGIPSITGEKVNLGGASWAQVCAHRLRDPHHCAQITTSLCFQLRMLVRRPGTCPLTVDLWKEWATPTLVEHRSRWLRDDWLRAPEGLQV